MIVLLDNIRSKFNVGSVFRTAEFFAFEKVVLTGFTPQLPDAEIAKTAIGAEKVMPWSYYQNSLEAVQALKKQGYKILVAELSDTSQSLADFVKMDRDPLEKICVVLGNEIVGVDSKIIEEADYLIEIPQLGTVKESLNVEVVFGVFASVLRF